MKKWQFDADSMGENENVCSNVETNVKSKRAVMNLKMYKMSVTGSAQSYI